MRTAYFERFEIDLTLEDALYGSQPGPCDSAIADLLQEPYIVTQFDVIPSHDIANELYEYGAWDKAELANEQENRARIVWIACGNIRENEATSQK